MVTRATAGIIYYTTNLLLLAIKDGCFKQIQRSGLPITVNDTVIGIPGALSMFKQIYDCLQRAKEDYVFFCEHDVLYHPSHFTFIPLRDDTFYYNTNVWGWDYTSSKITTYKHCIMLSGLCVNREFAKEFYRNRLAIIEERGYAAVPTKGCPAWALKILGFEPGIKKRSEPALISEWVSEYPNIDIRHGATLTRGEKNQKMNYSDFKTRKPKGWREDIIENLPGWDKPWDMVR
jgi:hypothetical protein